MFPNDGLNDLITTFVHATEESTLNAMSAAQTQTGIDPCAFVGSAS
jgi:hypothetical protein